LRAIRNTDPEAFGRLFALLQQLKADSTWIARLLDHGHGADGDETFSVSKWHGALKVAHLPLWRLKFWDLERDGLKYRVVYIYNWPDKSFNVMAVVHRNAFDYDNPNDPIRSRVFARCREEFPRA